MNMLFRSLRWVVGPSLALLGVVSPSYAETDDEYLLRMQQLVTSGQTGVGLFPIKVPGETFAGERSQIGHKVADFTLSGNGLASFGLVRKFQDSPAVEPYAFGNMSIELPTLSFRGKFDGRSDLAHDMTCSHLSSGWSANPTNAVTELYDDVKFSAGSSGTSLLPRALVNSSSLSNFPGDAVLVSKDNYYMKCDGAFYVLYAPDGTSYHFSAATGADRVVSSTITTDITGTETTHNFRTYRIRAIAIKRHNSTINLTYEAMPDVRIEYPADNLLEFRNSRARTPLAPTLANIIDTPKRLKSVVLIAAHDTNPGLPEFHALDIEYKADNDAYCPGLVNNIRQTYQSSPSAGISLIHQKRYGYRVLNFSEQGLVAAPRSACLLSKVEHADENASNVFRDLWNFSYGTYSGQSDGLVMTGRGNFHTTNRGPWNTSTIFGHTYIPLREVITPTNSRVVYEYVSLSPCEYQSHREKTTASSCSDSGIKTIAVSKRTVHYNSDGVAKSHETTFETVRHNAEQYQTWVKTSDIWHRLVFGRSFLDEEGPADNESLNLAANEKFLKAGRLLAHELRLPSGPILVNSTFDYRENGVFTEAHNSRAWFDYPEATDPWVGNQGWGWKNGRRGYVLNHRRVNRYKTTTENDGDSFINEVNFITGYPDGFDEYNKPKNVTESYTTRGGATGSRSISYSYDHDYATKYGWYVGLLAEVRRHSGTDARVDARTYNLSGLVSSRSNAGISSQYQYHLNGNLKASINGNNHATNYSNHKFGVPTTIATHANGLTTRVVDVRGNIASETIRKSGSQYNTTTYEYNEPFSRVSKILPPGGAQSTVITYPNWRANQRTKRETRGNQQALTHYDSLGRVDYAGAVDLGDFQQRVVNTVYDSQGRVIKTSDPSASAVSQIGIELQYDDLGRVISSRHSEDPSSVGSMLYCYGSDCAASSNNGVFNGAGAVLNGYAVRDQKGAVTVYNFEAYGSPKNAELVEIRQEIQPGSWYVFDDTVLVTSLERNKVGFVTKISQGGNGSNSPPTLERTYSPYKVNGSLTSLTKTETHPEFGTKTVNTFDGVGNPTSVSNFDGSVHTYTYDDRERLVYHTTPASTADINTAGTLGYTYFDNGSLRTISSSGSVWTYDYNANNLLTHATLDFAGESFSTVFQYDTELNLSQINYPSGQTVAYTSNGFGEQLSAGDYVSAAAYHTNGYLQSMTLGSGETYSTTLNNRKRVQQIDVNLAGGQGSAASALALDYTYTDRGNVESISGYFNANNQQSTSLLNLQYDGLSRLHKAFGNWGTGNTEANFSYEPGGNIDRRLVGGINSHYQYDASNKLLSIAFGGEAGQTYNLTYIHDDNGNIIKAGDKRYEYDHLNRLTDADRDDDGTTDQANSYDGHGHRVRTIVNDGQRIRTTFFVYDPSGTLLHEFDKETGEERDHIQFNGRTVATKIIHQNYDSDSDGLPDYFEKMFGLPVFSASNATLDSDGDGLTDLEEFQLGQIPTSTDSDSDGISDANDLPATPPVVITPLSPQGRIGKPVPTYVWQELGNATEYELLVFDRTTLAQEHRAHHLASDICNGSTCQFQPVDFDLGASVNHYWRVRAKNSAGYGNWSIQYFDYEAVSLEPIFNYLID